MKLKRKVVIAGFWNLFERFYNQLVALILNIILARLLFPSDYGLIGMITIFLVISQSFIEGGLINALIQKQERTENDFSTVFYFNIFVALSFYLIFFLLAPWVSHFYNVPELTQIMRVITISVIFSSFSIVPRSILAINLDFKKQAKGASVAITISGLLSVYFALNGLGVWTLVIQSITLAILDSIFLFILVKWKPKLIFSIESFKDLFGFGSKLLIANLIDRIFRNIYFLIIGKFYATDQLGYYTRAEQFSQIPVTNISGVIHSITFPKMCELQNNITQLRINYVRNIKFACLVSFPILLFISLYSEPIVLFILTDKWIRVAPILTLLSIAGLIYPINFLNMNLLLVKKRSDLYLRMELIKKVLIIIVLVITVKLGVSAIIFGQITIAVLSLFFNSYYTSKMIKYGIIEQLMDIIPFMIIAIISIGFSLLLSSFFIENWVIIIVGFSISMLLYLSLVFLSNLKNIRNDINALFNKSI
jgi:teichuronic acid exporter